ncbi:hypothetical protein AJ80_07658 [Polytolypa hystricis UAMH7299]|uniref:Uncharacterized protein n=1 Tax=Polytolypa hystricis (strain UAMH7299) TaxID=1447883 RepID=A0A2B7XL08_POLH7|nr:hypothetical protein AJ80_07658 [Polytolypa hystricis UAMH7299]
MPLEAGGFPGGSPQGIASSVAWQETVKKRRHLSADELDCCLSYRIGWPRPLPVLPLTLAPIFDESHVIANIDEGTHLPRPHHHKYDSGPTPKNISLIIPAVRGSANNTWVPALKEIRKYLASQDIHHRIEFIDFEAAEPWAFSILPGNPFVSL